MLKHAIPVIYGSSKVISYHKNVVKHPDFSFQSIQSAERLNDRKVNVLNCWEDTANISLGKPTEDGGKYAHIALDRAVRDLADGLIDVLVTGPINKAAMQLVNFPSISHTDYLEIALGGDALMIMVSDVMNIGMVTDHVALSKVPEMITKERVASKLEVFVNTLQRDFGYEKPTIAVLGLNPHASDDGLMGTEEEEVILPVITEFKDKGHMVMGPYSADGFFGSGLYRKFDGVLAMYHDQGLIPFKSLSFGQGVNMTAGLSHIRTSPDHGTAYNIAGQNEADDSSFREAYNLAIDLFRRRNEHEELMSNRLDPVKLRQDRALKKDQTKSKRSKGSDKPTKPDHAVEKEASPIEDPVLDPVEESMPEEPIVENDVQPEATEPQPEVIDTQPESDGQPEEIEPQSEVKDTQPEND